MLQARVFALGVFSDDAKVDVLMTGFVARNIFDEDNRGIYIKLLAQSNVKRLVTGPFYWSMQDTCARCKPKNAPFDGSSTTYPSSPVCCASMKQLTP